MIIVLHLTHFPWRPKSRGVQVLSRRESLWSAELLNHIKRFDGSHLSVSCQCSPEGLSGSSSCSFFSSSCFPVDCISCDSLVGSSNHIANISPPSFLIAAETVCCMFISIISWIYSVEYRAFFLNIVFSNGSSLLCRISFFDFQLSLSLSLSPCVCVCARVPILIFPDCHCRLTHSIFSW